MQLECFRRTEHSRHCELEVGQKIEVKRLCQEIRIICEDTQLINIFAKECNLEEVGGNRRLSIDAALKQWIYSKENNSEAYSKILPV